MELGTFRVQTTRGGIPTRHGPCFIIPFVPCIVLHRNYTKIDTVGSEGQNRWIVDPLPLGQGRNLLRAAHHTFNRSLKVRNCF